MRAIVAGDHPFVRRVVSREEARTLFAGPALQARAARGASRGRGDLHLHAGRVHGPVPRPARGEHAGEPRGLQADLGGGRVLPRRREEPDAAAHLRHGVRVAGRPGRAPEEAGGGELRDHRTLGRELDLFSVHEESVGPGLVHWHPKGARIRLDHRGLLAPRALRAGYEMLYTPHIGRAGCGRPRGIWASTARTCTRRWRSTSSDYYIKPMNCPFHIQIYKSRKRSYRDLPLRWAELGTVYRYERAGVLHGLMRVRGFTQDDAHIFCTPSRSRTRSARCCASRSPSGRPSASRTSPPTWRPGRRRPWASRRAGSRRTASLRSGAEGRGHPLRDGRGRRRLLRAQDRPQDQATRSAASGR